MSKWSDVKIYDLSIPIGVNCPPWPTYEPVQMKFFKRLSSNGANGQILTHSNHVGTHLDGPLHFDTSGRTVDQLELTKLVPRLMSSATWFVIRVRPSALLSGARIRRSLGSALTAVLLTIP